jgi:hypothetical protein
MVPVVVYATHEDFVAAAQRALQEFSDLLAAFVQARLVAPGDSELPGTLPVADLRALDCMALRAPGLEVLLRLTHGRGLWFAAIANERALAAATAFFRRSFVLNLAWLFSMPGPRDTFVRHRREFYDGVCAGMVREAALVLGSVAGNGRIGALHLRSYASFRQVPCGWPRMYVPRRAALDHLVAAASMSHLRLGAKAAGRVLDPDVWFEIGRHLDFA